MSLFLRIPFGLVIMIIGFLVVKKTMVIYSWFGANDFAEEKFGQGGSYFFYKLIGVLIVFIGIFIVTGVANDILSSVGRLLTNTKPQ